VLLETHDVSLPSYWPNVRHLVMKDKLHYVVDGNQDDAPAPAGVHNMQAAPKHKAWSRYMLSRV
jgi:hypothetical protein